MRIMKQLDIMRIRCALRRGIKVVVCAALAVGASATSAGLDLNGSWGFRFDEGKPLEKAAKGDFAATDVIPVPACYDMMPKWYMKRGTGLYRRSFTLAAPMKDAVLVVDGMGVRAKFELDGKDLGLHPYPYARLEIPVGPLAAGEHEIVAAVDNILSWPRVKLDANYENPLKGYHRDCEPLERFFRNLIMGERNELKNRYLLVGISDAEKAVLGKGGKAAAEKRSEKGGQKKAVRKGGQKTVDRLLALIASHPHITQAGMVAAFGITRSTIQKHIANLKAAGRLRRIGPDKGGHWEAVE